MGKLLPIIIAVIGLAVGTTAGYFLRPDTGDQKHMAEGDEHAEEGHAPDDHKDDAHAGDSHADDGHGASGGNAIDYVKLSNQFVVPVVHEGRVSSLVILSLSLEIAGGENDEIYEREPKLRDAFLDVLFDHANAGGFAGQFTSAGNMKLLRVALREAAQSVMGPLVSDVLIVNLVRQDT